MLATKNNKVVNVCEIYSSIEGEGFWQGTPSIFIRLQGCNLSCDYCDAAYTQDISCDIWNIYDLLAHLKKTYPSARHITLTGGEPLIQRDAEELVRVLVTNDYHVNIETNGTIPLPACFNNPDITIMMDYKCLCSGYVSHKNDKVIDTFDSLKDVQCALIGVKCVVKEPKELAEAFKFLKDYFVYIDCIFISPVFGSALEPLADATIYYNNLYANDGVSIKMQVQLHKVIWGDERGV